MTTSEIIYISSDESDEDVVFADLGLPKLKKSLPSPARKRSSRFGEDEFLPKITPFKMPKISKSLSFLKNKDMYILLKSKELAKLHAQDRQKAINNLEEDENASQRIKNNLSKEASKDEEYVNYVLLKHKQMKLEDLYVVGVPYFVEPTDEGNPLLEASAIPKNKNSLIKGDFFNTINYRVLERMEFEFDEEMNYFVQYIGVDLKLWKDDPVSKKPKKITTEDLRFDPCKRLQDIKITMIRVSKYVDFIASSDFDLNNWIRLIRLIGLLVMDKRVHRHCSNQMISSIIQKLFLWRYNSDKSIAIQETIKIWDQTTDLSYLKYRILEKLDSTYSSVIAQLRIQYCLFILSAGKLAKYDYYQQIFDLYQIVNKTILKELQTIYKSEQLHNSIKEDSPDARLFFQDLTLKLRCIIAVLRKDSNHLKADGFKDITVKRISTKLHELQDRITVSYEKVEQTSVKSLIMMLISIIDNDISTLAAANL